MDENIIYDWIDQELERQERLFPEQNLNCFRGIILLCEEVGEVARVALHDQSPRELQDQLLHVAAVAVKMLHQLGITDEPPCLSEAQRAHEGRG